MLRKLLIAVAVALAVIVAVVASRPAHFSITRSATIAAPDSTLFALVNDFHRWEAWSPWEKLDPAMQRTYDGAPAGTGAGYAWTGNKDVGEGRMTITESTPSSRILIRLEFLKPFAATNTTEFRFEPAAGGTTVTWTMSGENNFVAKAAGLVMDMDKMVGDDFEKGLAQLTTVAAAAAAAAPAPTPAP